MGDVALTVPVLKGMRKQYPHIEIVLITRPTFKPFFSSIEGLELLFPDLKKRHSGLSGLIKLFRDIKGKGKIDHVIDLHDVLRSKILRSLFKLSGIPVSIIDKGRSEKRSLITGKIKKQLKHTIGRYCDVFARAGFPVTPSEGVWIIPSEEASLKAGSIIKKEVGLNIGVAPYARHNLKMWPEENMIRLLELISENHNARFWLFGGKEDSEKLTSFQSGVPHSVNLAGKMTLDEELAVMSKLDIMISMDSSNMHMAALVGVKVISIWGGTDPLSGFGAWMQPDEFSISIPVDELTCRPCTVYGKGESKNDFACMTRLTPDLVYKRMKKSNIFL